MPRIPVLVAVHALGVATMVAFVSTQARSAAKGIQPASADRGFAGAWRLTFETPLGPSQSLLTVMTDDTVLFSGHPVSPTHQGNPVTFSSAGHGAWTPTGTLTAQITWIGLVSDGQGNFLAIVTDSVEATLGDDENSWSGVYSATVADPDGNIPYVGRGEVRATRIMVQPLATLESAPIS